MEEESMEFNYKIFSEDRLVSFRCAGPVTLEFAKESYLNLSRDAAFDSSFGGIGDWRGITQTMTPEETKQLAYLVVDMKLSSGRWAGLVSGPMITALGTIYRNTVKPQHNLELFSTIEGASGYLGKDVSNFLIQSNQASEVT